MLTETEARELLAEAAATIDVPPGEPIGAERRRVSRWLPIAVAAAVIALIAGVMVAVNRPESSTPVAPTPTPTPTPVSPEPDVIPSVFAYDQASAEELLTDRGLDVTVRYKETCDAPGRAVRTRPEAGTPIEPGDPVTLTVTRFPPTARCTAPADAPVWDLLDFANGRGPAPAFRQEEVSVFLNGDLTMLTGAEAADPAAWPNPSALDVLALAASEVQVMGDNDFWLTPYLEKRPVAASDKICGGRAIPLGMHDGPDSGFVIAMPSDGILGPCTFVSVSTIHGQIEQIIVRSSSAWTGGRPEPTKVDPVATQVGEAFLSFARDQGGDPAFAPSVRLSLGNELQKTIDEPADRARWDICATYAEASCPFSALATLRENDVADTYLTSQPSDSCLQEIAAPPDYPEGLDVVVLTPPEPSSCMDDFAVQVFYDNDGVISAVNLLLGSP